MFYVNIKRVTLFHFANKFAVVSLLGIIEAEFIDTLQWENFNWILVSLLLHCRRIEEWVGVYRVWICECFTCSRACTLIYPR